MKEWVDAKRFMLACKLIDLAVAVMPWPHKGDLLEAVDVYDARLGARIHEMESSQ